MNYLLLKSITKKLIKSKNVYNIFPESGIIYVHIPKTGGTSIRKLLVNLKNNDVLNNDKKKYYYSEELKRRKISSIHGKARDYLEFIEQDLWSKSLKFASVRNPWDLMVSSYHWWLQNGNKFDRLKNMYLDISKMNFEEYLKSSYGANMINECVGNIEDWFLDKDKNLILDGLVRLEHFENDFLKLIQKSNKKIYNFSDLPKENVTKRKEYQFYYNNHTSLLIEERFKFLIDYCGYKYDDI
tara:strand:- start:1077 stop:1799 length:723 start_codon:yes stop_codon:yes gene_type:complete